MDGINCKYIIDAVDAKGERCLVLENTIETALGGFKEWMRDKSYGPGDVQFALLFDNSSGHPKPFAKLYIQDDGSVELVPAVKKKRFRFKGVDECQN